MMLATVLIASQMLYVADHATFGCSSIEEVSKLQHIRREKQAFQKALYDQIFQGQCVEIAKGTVVEGSIDTGDSSILLVDRVVEPPGFMAPLRDFRKRKSDARSVGH